jgi:polyisoprenoid-binding protein YceI
VALQAGTYRLGPGDGALVVKTKRTGAAAKAGHNLVIDVTSWEATLVVAADPADSSLALDVDGGSLRVREGSGGMQELGDDDKANIEQTIDDEVLQRQGITFRSSEVRASADGAGLSVQGDLTLLGATRPLAFDVSAADDGRLAAAAVVKQSDWGMKPYSALFGALKVVDEVEVAIDATLPRADAPRTAAPSATAVAGRPRGREDRLTRWTDDEQPPKHLRVLWTAVALALGAEIFAALLSIA